MQCHLKIRAALFGLIVAVSPTLSATEKDSADSNREERVPKTELKEWDSIEWQLNDRWRLVLPLETEAGIGYLSGNGTNNVSGIFVAASFEASFGFQYKKKVLLVALNMGYDSREALNFPLDERHPHGGPSLRFRPSKQIDMGVSSDAGVMSRPGWIDLYQPVLDADNQYTGQFNKTDRNSYFHVGGDLYFKYRFNRQYSAEIYGGYDYIDYFNDPHFNEQDSPNHLVPGDRHTTNTGVKFTGTTKERFWRYFLDLRFENKQYIKTYARDAGTGLTHAAPGGLPANPRQHFISFRARQRNSFKLVRDVLHLVMAEEFTRNVDVFSNYYTTNAIEGDIAVKWMPSQRLMFSVGYGVSYERYTGDGYAASLSPNHPPLDNGDSIRDELSHDVNARAEVSVVVTNLKLFVDGKIKTNKTNFPDYEPGIFPATSQYRIDWDYSNWQLLCGIALEM